MRITKGGYVRMVADTELKALEQLGFDSPPPTKITL
nr:MAG TPA: hypothetical protein [Caudoviricetes sp.]